MTKRPTSFWTTSPLVSPWLTPLAESVNPAAFDPGVATPITVTGQNFLDGITVRLTRGEQTVSRLTLARLDAHTLTVDLPALGPGLYDLWVTNPGGQQSVKMGAIRVGKQSYCPRWLAESVVPNEMPRGETGAFRLERLSFTGYNSNNGCAAIRPLPTDRTLRHELRAPRLHRPGAATTDSPTTPPWARLFPAFII